MVTATGDTQAVGRIDGSQLYRATLLPIDWPKDEGYERELPFTIELYDSGQRARIWNGSERIEIPEVQVTADSMHLRFPHYDSEISAQIAHPGYFKGVWTKRRGSLSTTRMAFTAYAYNTPVRFFGGAAQFAYLELDEFGETSPFVAGRFTVDFESSDPRAVLSIHPLDPSLVGARMNAQPVEATFLTTLGDYRFLAGDVTGFPRNLRLSCFDGAHAFVFRARLEGEEEGSIRQLTGDFWSSDSWHESWTAVEDADASLPDAFDLTTWNKSVQLDELRFPLVTDDGLTTPRSPTASVASTEGLVLHLFGTWCPNCGDAAADLAKLAAGWQRDRNVRVVGLAFEHSEDLDVAAERVRVHKQHHGADFPVLVAGLSDKAKAAKAFPALDKVRAYPTTIFIDHTGVVQAVHTGWSGPATGAERERMLERFEELVSSLAAR